MLHDNPVLGDRLAAYLRLPPSGRTHLEQQRAYQRDWKRAHPREFSNDPVKQKAYAAKYHASEKGKATAARYRATERQKAYMKAYYLRQKAARLA